jgi:hypothetical protein
MSRKASLGAAFGILVCACGGSSKASQSAAPPPTAAVELPKPAPAAPAVPGVAPSSIDEASFSLRMAEAGPYKAGELARFVVHLEPRGQFHINQEYPIEIGLSGDVDTAFPKPTLARADAAEFGEKKARFDVPFTTKVKGDHKISANVKFAVCTAENCVPDERNLSLALAVK